MSVRIIGGYEHHSLQSIYYTLLHLINGSLVRGVDKFVRVGGWDVVKCIYVDILLSKYNVKQYYYIG